jgi:hypothetical protein
MSDFTEEFGDEIVEEHVDVCAWVARSLEAELETDEQWLRGREPQLWCIVQALESRAGTLARKGLDSTNGWVDARQLIDDIKSVAPPHAPPETQELLAVVDDLLDRPGEIVLSWHLVAEGVLLSLSDDAGVRSDGGAASREAIALLAELRDFVAELYHEIPARRLEATLREVRSLLEAD